MSWRNIGLATEHQMHAPGIGNNGYPSPPSHDPRGGNDNSNGSNGGGGRKRPSDERRAALSKADASAVNSARLRVSNLCPIQRYYDTSDRLLSAFMSAFEARRADDAYVLGKRYARFSLEALPLHDYYDSSRPELARLREGSRRKAAKVIELLEDVVRWMDEEEMERKRAHREYLRKLLREREEQRRAESERRKQDLAARAESKLRLLEVTPKETPSAPSPSPEEDGKKKKEKKKGKKTKKSKSPSKSGLPPLSPPKVGEGVVEGDSTSSSTAMEPGASPLPPPPSYDDVLRQVLNAPSRDSDEASSTTMSVDGSIFPTFVPPPSAPDEVLDRFADDFAETMRRAEEAKEMLRNGGPVPPPSYDDVSSVVGGPLDSTLATVSTTVVHPPKRTADQGPSPEDAPIPISDLRQSYRAEYRTLLKKGRVEVYPLNTYQGRIRTPGKDSTNGCTVISPLVVASHLDTPPGHGVADQDVEDIIDERAPPILREVRGKLGLGADALIVPSDVHDCLVDKKLLRQEQFAGAVGGNILDPAHLGGLLDLLRNGSSPPGGDKGGGAGGKKRKKKTGTANGDCNGKKVGAALFFHEHVVSIVKIVRTDGDCWYDLIDSMPRGGNGGNDGSATRTRCRDIAALEAMLRAYACAKFSDADCAYIDGNLWDDTLCDFDPRVFQAFVWAEQ